MEFRDTTQSVASCRYIWRVRTTGRGGRYRKRGSEGCPRPHGCATADGKRSALTAWSQLIMRHSCMVSDANRNKR